MATFLFNSIVFGPVVSRRLGVSLGINLLSEHSKYCNFNCIYCECGWNPEGQGKINFPPRELVYSSLEEKLIDMTNKARKLDVITFAGNGEPTVHPAFSGIIDDTVALRDKYCPEATIAVLSNATMLHNSKVVEALKKVDQNILKLDSGIAGTIQLINHPPVGFTIEKLKGQLAAFNGNFIIQSLFLRGLYNGQVVNNSTAAEIETWLKLISLIRPKMVMIYTIDRDTPAEGLEKISISKLNEIAEKVNRLGIETSVSG
jgi:wyosine [tRNA(Phe)-imidazoG37] synthetase (radical SAM superfamily)